MCSFEFLLSSSAEHLEITFQQDFIFGHFTFLIFRFRRTLFQQVYYSPKLILLRAVFLRTISLCKTIYPNAFPHIRAWDLKQSSLYNSFRQSSDKFLLHSFYHWYKALHIFKSLTAKHQGQTEAHFWTLLCKSTHLPKHTSQLLQVSRLSTSLHTGLHC